MPEPIYRLSRVKVFNEEIGKWEVVTERHRVLKRKRPPVPATMPTNAPPKPDKP